MKNFTGQDAVGLIRNWVPALSSNNVAQTDGWIDLNTGRAKWFSLSNNAWVDLIESAETFHVDAYPGGSYPYPGAVLQVDGDPVNIPFSMPFPRMTTSQRDAIVSPPAGAFVYNTTTNHPNYYNGSAWVQF